MIFYSVGKFKYDSSESCCLCLGFIGPRQFYARAASKIAHYKCAKKLDWKRASRKRAGKKAREIQKASPSIKVVRDGVIIKQVAVST